MQPLLKLSVMNLMQKHKCYVLIPYLGRAFQPKTHGIGAKGDNKTAGQEARIDMERLFGHRVFQSSGSLNPGLMMSVLCEVLGTVTRICIYPKFCVYSACTPLP